MVAPGSMSNCRDTSGQSKNLEPLQQTHKTGNHHISLLPGTKIDRLNSGANGCTWKHKQLPGHIRPKQKPGAIAANTQDREPSHKPLTRNKDRSFKFRLQWLHLEA
jgi:hypothetical protein